ncbi:MAG: hypothetical protein U1A22_03060, partial [Xanthomonadaceae bacterium]|nr:hypothetical protein [Xanthomonadaceae bacterium]
MASKPLKTQPTTADVDQFLAGIADAGRREECLRLLRFPHIFSPQHLQPQRWRVGWFGPRSGRGPAAFEEFPADPPQAQRGA